MYFYLVSIPLVFWIAQPICIATVGHHLITFSNFFVVLSTMHRIFAKQVGISLRAWKAPWVVFFFCVNFKILFVLAELFVFSEDH